MYGVVIQNLKFLLHFGKCFKKVLAALQGCASIMWFILIISSGMSDNICPELDVVILVKLGRCEGRGLAVRR